MKRVISLVLAVSMLVALIPAMTLSVSADEPSHPNPLCFTANTAGSKVKLEKNNGIGQPTIAPTNNVWYKTGTSWNTYDGSDITLANVGDKVYFVGDEIYSTSVIYGYHFAMTGSLSVSGSINSLIDSATDVKDLSGKTNCFNSLFVGCSALTDASNLSLPATTLANNCYSSMFSGCTSLAVAPELPATRMANYCYTNMFNGCSSLIQTPNLDHVNILADSCCSGMFAACDNLIRATNLLETNLESECYSFMFNGCSSLDVTTTDYSNDPTYGCWNFDSYGPVNSSLNMMFPGSPVTGTDYFFKITTMPSLRNDSAAGNNASEPEDDPETDIVVDGQTKTLKYGNNTVSVDFNTFNKTEIKDKENYTIDYFNSNAKIFDVIVPNSVVKQLGKEDKGIEFINRYGYMIVDEVDEGNNNSIVLRLKNTVASYAQVKAMNTKHVEAEVEVSYKSNGKSLPGNVKVYVPCDMETARVFYIIDKNTIGEWECEVKDGWCIFDRYLDGTYVVCK